MTPKNQVYRLTEGDREIFRRAANPNDGKGGNWFLAYYFGEREFRPWQWYCHHAAQPNITVVGGVGSGKTVGAGLSYATWGASTPRLSFMNLAPTGWQSKLMYDAILREADGKPFERFVHKYIERPYPKIILRSDYIGESVLHFMSAADDAQRIQGWEGDAMNLDEAGILMDGQWLLTMMFSRMRGNVPVPGGGFRPRLKRVSIITANYDFAPAWLWARMDMMHQDPEFYLSMQVKSSDNLSAEDIEYYKRNIPVDQHGTMLEGDKPSGVGKHFTVDSVTACEDWAINTIAQKEILEKETPAPGWKVEELPSVGCVRWEMPSDAKNGRQYLLVGDPGQGNAPHRNAPTIIVWDITEFPTKPATLRFFDWGSGNGSYDHFKLTYQYAWDTYRPLEALVDNTGTQKLWDEQIFLNMGLWVIGMDFTGQKKGMLVATMQQVERQLFSWPYIQGFRQQLVGYDAALDTPNSTLPQDIVACLMMTSFHLRQYLWEDVQEQQGGNEPAILTSAREFKEEIEAVRQFA